MEVPVTHPAFSALIYIFFAACIVKLAVAVLTLVRGYLRLIRLTVRTAVAVRRAVRDETRSVYLLRCSVISCVTVR